MPKLKFSKVIGTNTDFLTAQAFVLTRNELADDQKEKSFLAAIVSGSGEDVFTKVRQSAPLLEEIFFSEESDTPINLENTLSSLKKNLADVEDLQILLVTFNENILYISFFGAHQAYLLRNNKLLTLTPKQERLEEQLISGVIKEGDRVLLLSSRVIDKSDPKSNIEWEQQFIQHLINTPTDIFEEEANALLQQAQNTDPIALICIENSAETKTDSLLSIPSLEEVFPQKNFKLPGFSLTKLKELLKTFIPKSKKGKIISLGIGIVILVSVIVLVIYFQSASQKNSYTLGLIAKSQEKYNQSLSLKDSDSLLAQSNLEEARKILREVLGNDPKNRQALSLQDQINKNSKEILKIFQITDWPVFLSLDLIKQGFNASGLSFSLSKILLLDENQKSLVAFNIENKQPQILAGPIQLGQAKFTSINGSNAFVYSQDKGLLKVDLETQKVSTVSPPDSEWGSIVDIFGFGSNLYALDSNKNQIWKYVPIESGYSEKSTYVKEGQKNVFLGAKNLHIDYFVWVLKNGPEILKFTGGELDNFSVSGLEKPLQEVTSFFASEGENIPETEKSNIYFLEQTNSRIVVLSKRGEYRAQYEGEKFRNAKDFVVDEGNKKMYLLEDNKIYQIDLK